MTAKWAARSNARSAVGVFLVCLTLRATAAPIITIQPQSQTLNLGGLLELSVSAIASPQVRYQWRLNGDNIPRATNSIYSVPGLGISDGGSYTVLVYDQSGVATSVPALVNLAGLLKLAASDSFSTAGTILNVLNLVSYSNAGATSEPGEPRHAGVPGGKSVWFKWTALLNGVATLSTAGSSFDTLLAVYTGNNVTNLTEVVSDDDSKGFYTSKVTFNAVAGVTYAIVVDGAYGAEGNIILSFAQNSFSPAVPRISSQPIDQVVDFGGTAQFSASATGSGLSYQWYFNGGALTGATRSSLQVTNVSAAQVGRYQVSVTSAGQSVTSAPVTLQISLLDGILDVNDVARDKYQATETAIAGLAPSSATVVPATKRLFLHGRKVPVRQKSGTAASASGGTSRGYTGSQVFNTYAGGTQSGEPNNCETPGGSSAWTSVQPADNGVLTMDTDGSNFRTILGAYTGSGADFSSLRPVACDVGSGSGGTNSKVSFVAASNTVYYVSVDGVDGAYGTVKLHWSLAVAPAINAQPSSRTVSPGAAVTLTAGATGYPAPACQWWCNTWPIAGATNWSLTLTNFQVPKEGAYRIVASNASGSATSATASLLLNSQMRLDSCIPNLTNRCFQMRLVGIANTNYVIQASTNLITWVSIATNNSSSGLWTFTDWQSTNFSRRFYRAAPK